MTDDAATHLSGTGRSRTARAVLAERCRGVTGARWFAVAVFALIIANALVLGIETYTGVVHRWPGQLKLVEQCFLAAFTVEILLRAGAHADRPRDFFRDPWNLFDLAVVFSAFLPVVRENGTVLRLLRLARVLRTARFLPQLRVFLVAVGRSLPGTLSFLIVGALLLYVYAMVGWVAFAESDPEHFGSLGRAVLTLFLLMTLDGLGDSVRAGLEISRWSIVYYASYVLLASFVLVNVLIGVVISSLDEARDLEREQEEARGTADAVLPATALPLPVRSAGIEAERELRERILTARRALDDLEAGLQRVFAPPPQGAEGIPPGPDPLTREPRPG
ncbi:ion transporter [Streptomyces sp. NPDC020707]|jgi:voltage-gated sodium channel|uniref:ion transporter n=1 Tax=Streptomyces sp. NPDC020707 TaxID=3365084 RepID=UPI00379D9824